MLVFTTTALVQVGPVRVELVVDNIALGQTLLRLP